jgi:hypothetical protein
MQTLTQFCTYFKTKSLLGVNWRLAFVLSEGVSKNVMFHVLLFVHCDLVMGLWIREFKEQSDVYVRLGKVRVGYVRLG